MLILSRKMEESIIVDDNIEITVLEIEGGRVSLGISAPKNIEILRKELYLEVEDENINAVNKEHTMDKLKDLFKKE